MELILGDESDLLYVFLIILVLLFKSTGFYFKKELVSNFKMNDCEFAGNANKVDRESETVNERIRGRL